MQNQSTDIKEIFTSIQGEGLYIGEKHTFVRFCKCNLNCLYCDTDFSKNNSKIYSTDELYEIISKTDSKVISFTGAEPLCDVEFLYEFLKKYKNLLNKKIYLETNGTLYNNLSKIIDFVDIIAMDIKLKSATNEENKFIDNDKFLDIASKKDVFIKVIFDNNISDYEIITVCALCQKYSKTLVLQPKMPISNDINLEIIFNKFYMNYKNIRLIPQTHKFLHLP